MDKIPVPIGNEFVYVARYSKIPVICEFNKSHKGYLEEVDLNSEESIHKPIYDIEDGKINGMSIGKAKNKIKVYFDPPVKNIIDIKENEKYNGKFIISGKPSIGTIQGEYSIYHKGKNIEFNLVPSGGWKNNENKLSVKIIYSIVKAFKLWPKGYKWTGIITVENGKPYMESHWINRSTNKNSK